MQSTLSVLSRYRKNLITSIPTFVDNCRVYLIDAVPRKGPIAVIWDINNRCNARCVFCDYWKPETRQKIHKKELTINEKLSIIRKLRDAGVRLLSFCNGEPLLSEELELLIREAKKSHFLVNISTNGMLLYEKAEMLVNSKVDFITVSVDSHDPGLQDELRGKEGCFEGLSKGIEKIRLMRRHKHPYVEIRCLVNRLNGFQLNEFVDYWGQRADNVILKPIYENPVTLFKVPSRMKFKIEEEDRFRDYYAEFLDTHRDLDNLYHRHIPDFLFKRIVSDRRYLCFAGTFFGEIDCEGNLYPCQEMDISFNGKSGNIARDDFLELWSSAKMQRLRRLFKSGTRCSCWVERFIFNIYLQNLLNPLDRMLRFLRKKQ